MRPAYSPPQEFPAFTLALRGIRKRYPGVIALDDVSMTFTGGEMHVLLGENGAGKSTLISLLAGMQQPTSGEIRVDGVPHRISSPRRSIALGIGTVSQHLLQVSTLTVLENLMLGGPWWKVLDRAASLRHFDELAALLGARIQPNAILGSLDLGQRQVVEIMRAQWRDARLLLLDEPTSLLTPQGVSDLKDTLRRLRDRGTAIVLITHKLREAYEFGDCVTVLRQGRVAGTLDRHTIQPLSEQEFTRALLPMMFSDLSPERIDEAQWSAPDFRDGASEQAPLHRVIDREGVARLRVSGISSTARGAVAHLKDVTFELWPGEILGIAGIDGNGQKHLAEVLSGQRAVVSGTILLNGRDITAGGVPERRQQGVYYLTDERMGEGSVGAFSVATNLIVKKIGAPPYWVGGFSHWPRINQRAREQIADHGVRTPSELTPLGTLSGGTIQKVLLVRELEDQACVVILNKPTYGLDLQNQRQVQERILAIARGGVALIIISTDLDELLALSHRIAVFESGCLQSMLENGPNASQHMGRLLSEGSSR